MLFVTIALLLQSSMEGTYHRQVFIVVFGMHLVLLVLAALVICVVISMGIVVPWSAPSADSACCTCRICCYMCMYWSHLVLSVVAALGMCWAICLHCGVWSTPGAVSAVMYVGY